MIYLSNLLEATHGELSGTVDGELTFTGFCFDSRRAKPGELFVALRTESGDGHDYISDALARGAAGALVDEGRLSVPVKGTPDGSVVVNDTQAYNYQSHRDVQSFVIISVPDTYNALTHYARTIIRKRDRPVIAITGSVGKTSTRAAVAAVLGRRFNVFQNPANFNGRLGVPIALGTLEPEHEIIVLEMAADRFGEIRELCDIAPPHIGIVTNVSEAHLAYFGSLDATAIEKRALVEALPDDGVAILNGDDPRVWAMRGFTKARVISVAAGVRVSGSAGELKSSPCASVLLPTPAPPAPPHPRTLAQNIAREVGKHYGIAQADIEDALAHLSPLPGRMNTLRGVNGTLLIDDSFSASPASMRAAIETVVSHDFDHRPLTPGTPLKGGSDQRRFLILGDMDQLGEGSLRLHHEIGALIAKRANPSVELITLGEQAQVIAAGARDAGMPASRIVVSSLARDVVEHIKRRAKPGDLVLVKGDVSARMERIVLELLAEREDAQYLARQEPGWDDKRVRVAKPARPTWLDVDLEAIAHNVRVVKALIGQDVALMAVLKADGYGHGAVNVARTALNNGASYCGVASLNEAVVLRNAHIDAPILILGFTPPWHAKEALLHDVAMTVYDLDVARAYSRAATELHRIARLHVKIDTGMGRLGALPGDAPALIGALTALPNVKIEGVFTHFSCADSDAAYTQLQMQRFNDVLFVIRHSTLDIRYVHAANSAATLVYPEARFNMVRVGLAMYGLNPLGVAPAPLQDDASALKPALTWKTTIAQVKTLPPGAPVSYGNTYVCQRETTIAVIPVGYADGFRRAPHSFGEVLVRGQRAPLVGRVCMDQTMIDVTDIPGVRLGDEVVLIGAQGEQQITADDVAARLGTISYEVVSAILPRVPRVS